MAVATITLLSTGQVAKAEIETINNIFLPFVKCNDEDINNRKTKHPNDIIQGGNEKYNEFLTDERYKYDDKDNREFYIYELITNDITNINVNVSILKGSKYCTSKDTMFITPKINTFESDKDKISVVFEKGKILKYDDKLNFTINTTLKEGDSISFYVDFYAKKNTSNEKEIPCGRMKIIIKGNCFCNRDFTVQELQKIITYLRKEEDYISKLKMYDRTKDLLFAQATYDMKPSEEFSKNESTYRVFTKMLNDMFRKYEINTCARKIHFLAQSYAETDRFRCSVECTDINKYDGYIGRGFIHLTGKIAYFKYFNYHNNYKYIPAVIENDKSKENKENEETFNSFPKIEAKIKEFNLENELYEFRTQLAKSMWYALDSAGWYWRDGFRKSGFTVPKKNGDINLIADKIGNGDITEITKSVNGGLNGLGKRKLYTKLLMDKYYDKCKNKK